MLLERYVQQDNVSKIQHVAANATTTKHVLDTCVAVVSLQIAPLVVNLDRYVKEEDVSSIQVHAEPVALIGKNVEIVDVKIIQIVPMVNIGKTVVVLPIHIAEPVLPANFVNITNV